jgi:hypothetical protein
MAVVLAPSSVHSSSHLLVPHRDTFGAIKQHRSSSTSYRNPFEAFAPHHHSGANSRSAAASWRHSGPQTMARARAAVDTTSTKLRRSGSSYSDTPSSSSEASGTSWRIRSGAVERVDVTSGEHLPFFLITILRKGCSGPHHLKVSPPFVYSVAELLHLSTSPLVGMSKESQGTVDDVVAHYVWRRGAHSGSPRMARRRNNRDTSKTRSLHTSTDDSEHSD